MLDRLPTLPGPPFLGSTQMRFPRDNYRKSDQGAAHPLMNFYFPMQACQDDTEAACLQTNKYLPEDRQGTSAYQDSGEDPKIIRVLLMMEPPCIRGGLCPVLRPQW